MSYSSNLTRYSTELVISGHIANATDWWGEVDLIRMHGGLEIKILQESSKKYEKFHAGQTFPQTDAFTWRIKTDIFIL